MAIGTARWLDLPAMHGYLRLQMQVSALHVVETSQQVTSRHKSAPERQCLAPVREYYNHLSTVLGPQHWWPAKTHFEIVVGAILTQNTSWTNVEQAMANLRSAPMLFPLAMLKTATPRLARLIRPSGYFRQKAKKLKAFCKFLSAEYGGSLARMFATPTAELREKLLGVFGIGPETADSILIYAGKHPVFVVDTYTKRILRRHGWVGGKASYDEVQGLVTADFPREAADYNELHALFVQVGKNWCRGRETLCTQCPLQGFLKERR
jgi:endonuclease III related protein